MVLCARFISVKFKGKIEEIQYENSTVLRKYIQNSEILYVFGRLFSPNISLSLSLSLIHFINLYLTTFSLCVVQIYSHIYAQRAKELLGVVGVNL